MKVNRRQTADSSKKNIRHENVQVAQMSLAEFMQKGFSSEDEEADGSSSTTLKVKKEPTKNKKISGGANEYRSATLVSALAVNNEEPSHKDPYGEQDDIEDLQSDNEVITKPRAVIEQPDSDEETLDEMQLSDDGEDETDITDIDVQILTERKLSTLLDQLRRKPDTNQIKRLIQIFNGAVREASGDQGTTKPKYSVRGQRLFNAVVFACLQDLLPAVHKVMKLSAPSVPKDGSKMIDPTKGHLWRKLKNPMTLYMTDLLRLIGCLTQQKLLLSLLRHILLLLPFIRSRPQIEKRILKTLSHLWSSAEESIRVVSFLCLIRLIRSGDDTTFQEVLKAMYLAYVANSKFTSPQTWPLISFMRRSLVEAYALRPSVAYQHSFLYIRQLAITLRTAMAIKKRDSFNTVYNWQFVHSLLLWCHLLATVRTPAMQPLVYPVIQVAVGALNLIPSEKYIPLRLHVIRGLMELSAETETFVPIMPMLVATIKLIQWNKKPKVVSMKPMNLSCALRVSDKQTKESAFRDASLEAFQEMALNYLTGVSHVISFPEIVIASLVELKKMSFRVVKHQTMAKHLLDKITENSRFIERKREHCALALKELEKIAAFELKLRGETPLCVYSEKYHKIRERNLRVANEDIVEHHIDSDDETHQGRTRKTMNKKLSNEDENMDTGEECGDYGKDDAAEHSRAAKDVHGTGKLDSDLDTEEEGDDEIGFEIASDADDTESSVD